MLHAETWGKGDPLVLIHGGGLGTSGGTWHDVIPSLAKHHRVIAADAIGFGLSDAPARDYNVGLITEHLLRSLDVLCIEKASLVGHSMGGMTIMALAQQHPELFGTKVAGAVLISTAARGLDGGSPWMPGPIRPLLSRALPGVLSGAAKGRRALLVERGRRVTDLTFLSTRLLGFGDDARAADTGGLRLQLWPHRHGTDAMSATLLRRRKGVAREPGLVVLRCERFLQDVDLAIQKLRR